MMKTTIKTETALSVYRMLSQAKYTKLSDEDKIKVWKIGRILKPIATEFDEHAKDAAEKMQPTKDFSEKVQQAQEFERVQREPKADASELKMGAAEYNKFIVEFNKYKKLVDNAVKEFGEKEVKIEFEPLTEDSFGKLMASNDWTIEQVLAIEIIVGK